MTDSERMKEDGDSESDETPETTVDPLVELSARLSELTSVLSHLAEVKLDQLRHAGRQLIQRWAFGLGIAVVTSVLVVLGAAYFVRGMSGGFAVLFGAEWAGHLAAGVGTILIVALTGVAVSSLRMHRIKRELVKKYEQRNTSDSEAGPQAEPDAIDRRDTPPRIEDR